MHMQTIYVILHKFFSRGCFFLLLLGLKVHHTGHSICLFLYRSSSDAQRMSYFPQNRSRRFKRIRNCKWSDWKIQIKDHHSTKKVIISHILKTKLVARQARLQHYIKVHSKNKVTFSFWCYCFINIEAMIFVLSSQTVLWKEMKSMLTKYINSFPYSNMSARDYKIWIAKGRQALV